MRMILLSIGLVLMIGLVLIGCERQPAAQVQQKDEIPVHFILDEEPTGAADVRAVKSSAKEGDEVVIRGVIGGRPMPIAPNRAVFTIIDSSLTTCDKMGGDDHCKTPWDACCEAQDDITAGSATVQIVDPTGTPLRLGLNGQAGIAPLKEITVVGTVRGPVDEKNLIIDVSGIYVKG